MSGDEQVPGLPRKKVITKSVAGDKGQGKDRWQARRGLETAGRVTERDGGHAMTGPVTGDNSQWEDCAKPVAGPSKLKYSRSPGSETAPSLTPVSRSAYASISEKDLVAGLYDMVQAVRLV